MSETERNYQMDSIDKTIISTLQKNGRTTNVELARLAELAPSSMLERVRRLEERGVIKGYRATLDPTKLGYNVQAIVMVSLEHTQLEKIDETEEKIRSIRFAKVGRCPSRCLSFVPVCCNICMFRGSRPVEACGNHSSVTFSMLLHNPGALFP